MTEASPLHDPRRMVGDPLVSRQCAKTAPRLDPDLNRDACLYAAAMMTKVGRLPPSLSAVDVIFQPPATLVFVSADAEQAEVGRFVIPGRVLTYRPRAVALPQASPEQAVTP